MAQTIESLFANDIRRPIEEVIKVDQTDEGIIRAEIDEYVVTSAIAGHYARILERYQETPNKPHEGIGVWVSGFFGSGKSSFAKLLGLSIGNRAVAGEPAAGRFAARAGDARLSALLSAITEQIPTHVVIFDVSTDRGIRSGNQTLREIMYGLFLQSLGYAKDLDVSELEISLEERGLLGRFEEEYARTFGKAWEAEKGKVAFALSEASRVMHALDPATYPAADSWVKAARNRMDISAGKLAERCNELMKRRQPGRSLMFVVDEVGQFVARDVQKMLDLQAVVQQLGVKGRGKHWLVVTSQEKLGEVVTGLDGGRNELARLMDRFPQDLQVHLEPSDISEVTSRRVLAKNAAAQKALGEVFEAHRGRLTLSTTLTADITLPELTRQAFVDLYPLLPYQVDLIVHIVSGLRTQGGASRQVGGANRTIIKLAQQVLINPAVALADKPIGALVRADHVYDLVEGNIGSEVRAKIAAIPRTVQHPLAHAVAKTICLLQYVKSVHRTAENIAAALHPAVDADSRLAEVKEALQALVDRHQVRLGDDGYRIPTPAEDDWERTRQAIAPPRPGEAHRLHADTLASFWQPAPSHTLLDTKTFKAGLALHGKEVVPGDLTFQVYIDDDGDDFEARAAELRARSQQERKAVFWAVGLSEAIRQHTTELFRSQEMLSRKGRDPRSDDAASLVAEEKTRLARHQAELRRLLRAACLSGTIHFRGNDRSPGDGATEVGRAAGDVLGQVLPQVFERFHEAAARVQKKDLDALFTSENLHGLTPVFTQLGLLKDEKGKPAFRTDAGPLAEVLRRIEERAGYGDRASGRQLADALVEEPFGWDFDVVRLLVVCLLRAGKIEVMCKNQVLESATAVEARDLLGNNNTFRAASFAPKKGPEFDDLIRAAQAFEDTFGAQIKELNPTAIVADLRRELGRREEDLAAALATLRAERLPGAEVLETALGHVRAIQRGTEPAAISAFNSAHRALRDAVRRAVDVSQALTEPRLADLARARRALGEAWPFLEGEPDLPEPLRTRAAELRDLLAREDFFRELPAIEQHAGALLDEYDRRYRAALAERAAAYERAHEELVATPGWAELSDEARATIAAPVLQGIRRDTRAPVPQLRSERDACEARLKAAVAEVLRVRDGERLVRVSLGTYFTGGIETEEQLDQALAGVRERCARLIGEGKKVLVQ